MEKHTPTRTPGFRTPGFGRSLPYRDGLIGLGVYGALWFGLSGNQGWAFGAVFVVAATLLSLRLGLNLRALRPLQVPVFLLFYLRELLAAGWQVAWSACHWKMPIAPRWVYFELTSRSPRTQLLLSVFVGLLPGTLASRVRNDAVELHILDIRRPWRPTVEKLETRLMALTGERSS